MTDPTPQTPPRSLASTPLWVKLVLVLSVAANLLVVGVVAGAVTNARKASDGPLVRMDGPNPFLRAMNAEDARQMRGLLRDEGRALRTSRSAGRDAVQAILVELRAADPSETRLRAAFEALNAANSARAEMGQEAILTYLLTLDPEARADFADRLEQSFRRGPTPNGRPPRQP